VKRAFIPIYLLVTSDSQIFFTDFDFHNSITACRANILMHLSLNKNAYIRLHTDNTQDAIKLRWNNSQKMSITAPI
jgi:hypothetical protein